MNWYQSSQYQSEKDELVKKLTATAKGRNAGKEIEKQWSEEFTEDETMQILNIYLDKASEDKDMYTGHGNEEKTFLSNKYFKAIVDKMRMSADSDARHALRDRAWIVLDSLMKIGKADQALKKYLDPSGFSWSEPKPEQERSEAPTASPREKKDPANAKSELPIVPILIGVGVVAFLLLRCKK
jgi:hypothetical protein